MKNLKQKILILLSIVTCVCVAIGGLNIKVESPLKAQASISQMFNGGIDCNQNLFEQATFSDTNYIINKYSYSGTVGGYLEKLSNVTVNTMSNMPTVTTDASKAWSYSGARITLDGTTTLDMGVVDLSQSSAKDADPVIGFLPTVNFLGPKSPADSLNPYLGIYYTFRSTVNPDKYFDIGMRQAGTAYEFSSLGVSYNGVANHYGQSNANAGTYYAVEAGDRIGGYPFRFDGSMPTNTSSAAKVSNGRYINQIKKNGTAITAECNAVYPVKVYYDYATSKFYTQAVHYEYMSSYNSNYFVTATNGEGRFLLLDASAKTEGKGYSTSGSYAHYNSKCGWTGFTEEEAKSVAVTMHVDWNPEYTGSHDIVITDFAGQKVSTQNADSLKANRGTVGVLKEFTASNGIATLSDGYSVNLSDNDIFTKLVEFEVYPEQVGTTKAVNNSGLFEVAFNLSDGTNNLKINLKNFEDNGSYRNCYTVSVNGESKWALDQGGVFGKSEYGFPVPYNFDKYIRYPITWVLDQYSANTDAGETVGGVYPHYGISTSVNRMSQATFAIYYNAADNSLYTDAGRWGTSYYTTHTKADGTKVKRWKIADLDETYSGARTAFGGFGDKNLTFSMATTLMSGFDSVKIRILELDGQKLSTKPNENTYLDALERGLKGQTYEFTTPSAVSELGDYDLSVVAPSGDEIQITNDKFVPTEVGEYEVTYVASGRVFKSSVYIYESAVTTDSFVANFSAINGENVKSISYGEFTSSASNGASVSGSGLMVYTRNKETKYINQTTADNENNPWLYNFGAGTSKNQPGVAFDKAVDISDNKESDTLIELYFPADANANNGENDQAKAYRIVIADASDSTKYIALYLWDAWHGSQAVSMNNLRVTAVGSWEAASATIGYSGYDDGSKFTQIDANIEQTGKSFDNIRLSSRGKESIKVNFDYQTGKLYLNGILIRSFKDVSANGTNYFNGFTDGKVKLSVNVERSNRLITEEWTRFFIMGIDGVSFATQKGGKFDGKILDDKLGLSPYMSIIDTTTGKSFVLNENDIVNVGDLFSNEESRVIGYYDGTLLKNISDLNGVVLAESKEYKLAYLDFYTEAGASIRISGYTGLRFRGFIDSQIDASIQDNIKEYGMILAPTDYIENKAFTLDDYQDGSMYQQPAENTVEGAELTHFYVTMTHLKATNMAREFSARVYVEISYDDGTTGFVYSNYTETDNSRSAYEVAKSAYNDEDEYAGMDETTATSIKTFLQNNYLNKVIDVNTLGVKANDDATYTVDSVSTTETTISLVVSGASGVRCLVYDGAAYWANGSTLIMEDSGDKLNVTFTLPTRIKNAVEQAVTIIDNGTTDYAILVPSFPSQSELFAAEELKSIIKNTYGAEMPIVSVYDSSTTKYISLGDTELKKKSELTLSSYTKNQGGFGIKSYGDGVAIYAEDDYALFYGMYRFLEENFGYMYYAYDCAVIDESPVQTLKNFNYEDFPDFRYRSMHSELTRRGYYTGDGLNMPANMKAAYINMHLYDTGSRYVYTDNNDYKTGNYGYNVVPFSQTLDDQSMITYFLPYDSSWDYFGTGLTYGAENPNWYYKESGKVRQICFTRAYNNDNGMYDIVLEKLKTIIVNNPQKIYYEIGVVDTSSSCQCSQCKSAYNTYGESGVYLRFVNKLASDIKTWQAINCPRREIYLMAYAYHAFIEPPKGGVTVADNVIIRIAPITLDYSKAITASNNYYDDSWTNRITWKTIFDGWAKVAANLAIWDYRADFRHYLQPLPFQKSTEANIEYFKSLGVKEIFAQGVADYQKISIYPFAEMDDWIRSRMYWDSSLSYNDLRDEFINAYYGAAASYVLQYISKIESVFGSKEFSLGEDLTVSELKSRYNSTWVSQTKTIFDNAYSSVSGNAEITRRLDYLSMFYRYLQIKCSYEGADKATFKTMCEALGIWKVEINLKVEDFTA